MVVNLILKVTQLNRFGVTSMQLHLLLKQKSQVYTRKLTKNGIDITSPKQICNTLNEYFCNIGPTSAKNIHCSTNDFMQYCFTTVKDRMYCNPVSAEEITNVVSRFQDNKSPGFDNIGSKL